jgi:hypothetical protein
VETTSSFGIASSAVPVEMCLVRTDTGEIAVTRSASAGGGVALPGPGASGGVIVETSNAAHLDDLTGRFVFGSASVAAAEVPVGAEIGGFTGLTRDGKRRIEGGVFRIALSTPGVQVVGGVSNTWIVHRFQNGVSRSIANQVFNQIESQAQGGVLVAESAQVLTRLLERYLSPPGAVLAPADHSPLWQSSSSNVA